MGARRINLRVTGDSRLIPMPLDPPARLIFGRKAAAAARIRYVDTWLVCATLPASPVRIFRRVFHVGNSLIRNARYAMYCAAYIAESFQRKHIPIEFRSLLRWKVDSRLLFTAISLFFISISICILFNAIHHLRTHTHVYVYIEVSNVKIHLRFRRPMQSQRLASDNARGARRRGEKSWRFKNLNKEERA